MLLARIKSIPTDVVVKMERVDTESEEYDEEWQSNLAGFTSTKESEKISLNEEMNKHWVNIREILKWSNATPIRSYGGRGYLCCYCSKQFVDPRDLRAHTSQSHIGINDACFTKKAHLNGYCIKLDITELFCNICGESIDNVELLLDHLSKYHSIQIYTDIKNLIVPFKFNSEELQCCICDEKFGAFKVLLAHMNDHIRNYVCEVCDAGFVNVKQLRGHAEIHKTGSHKCEQCGKVFSTMRSCSFHMNRVHRRTFVYKCGHCSQSFKESRQKQKHQLEVHGVGAVITCEYCERCFKNQTTYKIHVNRDHLKLRKFACTMCEMRFYKCSDLHDHMVRHTGERVYKCEICQKAFARRKTLREHTRIHLDDKRFKCEHCDKGFVQKCNLRTHLLNKHKLII
ncbi:unnamed protein product [Pieris macdunnoughi]|uniref:C2H2-type domain-containing protein n=1 Tax=Pieris macdunnoughi TaxID=345717 RepID=A0A821UFA8_9NEOP|nr:unnamed protein product [Pieris macdunnoughi]